MVAYNFQEQFAHLVETGQKRQTIRAPRYGMRHAAVGEPVQLYTGMRTKACRKLVDPDPICTASRSVWIDDRAILLDYRGLAPADAVALAVADGFADWPAFVDWFARTHGLPFTGHLIEWASRGAGDA